MSLFSTRSIGDGALSVSALSIGPVLDRMRKLQNVEAKVSTRIGHISGSTTACIPILYLYYLICQCDIRPGRKDWFAVLVEIIVACLQLEQDKRILLCCPEVAIFWVGKSIVHTAWATQSTKHFGLTSQSCIPPVIAVSTVLVVMSELENYERDESRESADAPEEGNETYWDV